MALRITYVPFNSSHMRKALPVLHALRQAGADSRILCLDAMQVQAHHLLRQVQRADFDFSCPPQGRYRPHPHWLVCAVQRRKAERYLESLLKNDRSDVFVLSDDTLVPTRLLAKYLVQLGVPYILIADGLQPPLKPSYRPPLRERFSRAARRVLYGWGPRGTAGARRILVVSKTCRSVLQGYGISSDRIVVVGSPEYDQLAVDRLSVDEDHAARTIRTRLGLVSDQPIVFYAHQKICGRVLTEGVVWNLAAACRRIGASLLVKFHPHSDEDPAAWRALAQSHRLGGSTTFFFKSECTSIEAVQVCTVCVTAFSTVSLEAMIYRRPVLVLQYLPVRETLRYARDYGAALDVDASEEVTEAIRTTVEDRHVREQLIANGREALRQELHDLDGRSLQRTVAAILDILPRA